MKGLIVFRMEEKWPKLLKEKELLGMSVTRVTARFVSSQGLLHGLVLCDIVGGGVDLGGGGWIAPRTSAHDCRGHGLVRGLQNLCSAGLRAVLCGECL